jgi:hypothetical protein
MVIFLQGRGEVLQAHTDRSTARHPYSSILNYGKPGIWPKFTNVIFVEIQTDMYKWHSPVYLNRQSRNPLTFKEIKRSNFLRTALRFVIK